MLAFAEACSPKEDYRIFTGLYGNTVQTVTNVESCEHLSVNYGMLAATASGIFCCLIQNIFIRKETCTMKKTLVSIIALTLSAIMLIFSFSSCGKKATSGVEDGVLTIAMECTYAPYNWTQGDDSNGAVEISNAPGEYVNGYDVMIAKKICEANGWELEIIRSDWDSLVPSVQTGIYDAVIAGQSMTEKRSKQVDFAGPYYYASIVCLTKVDSPFADATGKSDLAGGTCTAQIETIWYDSCLPQIDGAVIKTASESAPAMLMALETDTVDFICTDMPTAMGACAVYPDMKLLDFSGSGDDFEVDEGEINIGVSVMKGNTVLKEAIDSVLSTMTVDDFSDLMNEAIAVQPLNN